MRGLKAAGAAVFLMIVVVLVGESVRTAWSPVEETVVVLDPGHGGWDPGKVEGDLAEKDLNLRIAKTLALYLQTAGFEVRFTRQEDQALAEGKKDDLSARRDMGKQADIFISIHQNAYPSPEVFGAQVFYPSGQEKSQALAEKVQQRLVEQVNPQNHRQAKANDSYFVLKDMEQCAILVECGFLSNPDESQALTEETYQHKIAWAIYLGLMDEWLEEPEAFIVKNSLEKCVENQRRV